MSDTYQPGVGGVTSRSGASYAPGSTPTATASGGSSTDAQLADKFPSYAWAMNIPELANVIRQADANNWTPAEVASHIQATTWWRENSNTKRQWDQLIATDPTEAQRLVDQQISNITAIANKMGVTLDRDRTVALAQQANAFGWTAQQLQETVAAYFQYSDHLMGNAGLVQTQLMQMAQKYMVKPDPGVIQKWVQDVIAGKQDPAAFQQELINEAKSRWASNSQIRDALDRGVDMESLTSPYKQLAAQTLEIAPDAVDWLDLKWAKALDVANPDGIHSMMSLADWRSALMTDPVYGYDRTSGARTQAADLATKLAQSLGSM